MYEWTGILSNQDYSSVDTCKSKCSHSIVQVAREWLQDLARAEELFPLLRATKSVINFISITPFNDIFCIVLLFIYSAIFGVIVILVRSVMSLVRLSSGAGNVNVV